LPTAVIELADVSGALLIWMAFSLTFVVWLVAMHFLDRELERLGVDEVNCPGQGHRARLQFLYDISGKKLDVMQCSLLGEATGVTCGKACLPPSV
jgi:hypothetical protein